MNENLENEIINEEIIENEENNEVLENEENEEVIEDEKVNEKYKGLGLRPEEIRILEKQDAKENGIEFNEKDENEEKTLIVNKFEDYDKLIESGNKLKEKFNIDDGIDFDDLTDNGKEKYYKKLEKLIGEKQENKKEEKIEENYEEQDFFKDVEMDENDKKSFNSYANEYIKNNGKISEETRNDIKEKYKIPDVIIDEYLSNLDFKIKDEITKQNNSKQYEIINSVYKNVAPQEEISKSLDWADTNLTDFQKELFNRELASNDKERVLKAAKEINDLYKKNNIKEEVKNIETKVITGKRVNNTNSKSYNSKQEYMNDLRNPKYKSDIVFRKNVEKKLLNSNIY
jgi:hypothetical protein